ncbi:hypothetical protein HXX76_009327 [Chlamydomonas incerta]|uniref:Peptidase M50 domain-containing protein n=1 Tax=Chlamydomonas incerta TaxID=51695 RepID=A0A835VZW8_CHLIN|nr:hypothetical protein HXX76_009327 [Chlamydomonas incerta]|eukprot:KAG2431834.1 hypothetical protein HXX76_009327 [Chlamydomonas incerta]
MATALSAAALLNGALLAHEAGHLAAARALGVAVGEFAVGVGPRVAWWQGATGTTYSLRAFPLFGYVTFLSAAQLGPEGLAALQAAAAGRRPRVLLEWLSPGRRAAVVAAGVVANALLAAAFVGYQVARYGELGVVVRPGARVRAAEGHIHTAAGHESAAAEETAAMEEGRLRAGDVVLRVGRTALPAGGDMDAAIVHALEVEAAAAAAAAHNWDGAGAAAPLEGVTMTVLRKAAVAAVTGAAAGEAGLLGASSSGRGRQQQQVLQLDAAEVLRYETLVVGPNTAAGYRRPAGATEAAHMLGREYYSWASVVLRSWAEAASAAVSFARGGSSSGSSSSSSSGGGAAAAAPAGSSSGVSGAGGSAQMVGPLGLVASAAAMAVAADRESRAPSSYSLEQDAAAGGSGSGYAMAGSESISYSEQPPALLDLGIQLNLQLAAVNMLPLPVLDGGQLLLVALEAARGGRRLPAGVERSALLASALLVGGWVAALSLSDVVGLADKAAGRLAAALASGPHSAAAAAGHGHQLQLAVSVGGSSSGSVQGISRGFAADAAAALDASTGAWAL